MPDFPIQYAQGVPQVVKQPRASIDVDTGAGLLGQAATRMGEAIFGLGQKIQLGQDAMRLSVLERDSDELTNVTSDALSKIKTQEEADAIIKSYQEKAAKLAGKDNSSVRNAYTINYNRQIGNRTAFFKKVGEQARAKDAHDQWKFAYSRAIDSGDQAAAEKTANLALATEVIGEEEYKTATLNLPVDIQFSQIRKLSAVNPDEAEKQLNAMSGLTVEQLDKKDSMIAHINAIRNRSNSALREQQEKETWDLFKASEDGTLTREMLDASVMPADEKQEIWRNFKTVQAAKARGEISVIEEGDPAVLAQVMEIVDLRPDMLSPSQIYQMTKNGLGTKHVTTIVDRLNRNKTEKNPIAAKYRAELGRLHSAELFGKKDKFSTSDTYLDLSRKLDTFLAMNPTDEQAQRFFSKLIREKAKSGRIASIFDVPVIDVLAKYGALSPGMMGARYFVKKLNISRENPTPDELRDAGTEEAYKQGVSLGYWK